MADTTDTKSEPKVEKVTTKVVDFHGEPAPKESEVGDLLVEEAGSGELEPEEAKAEKLKKKKESIAATGGGYPDTPSGRALAAVGDLDGEDAESLEQSRKHGLAYGREKRKWRWGY